MALPGKHLAFLAVALPLFARAVAPGVLALDSYSLGILRQTMPAAARNADRRSNLYKLRTKLDATVDEQASQTKLIPPPMQDNSTYANINQIRTEHLHFDLLIDFDTYSFVGNVVHHMVVMSSNVSVAQFDIWDINVKSASLSECVDCGYVPLKFAVLNPNPDLGSVLAVYLDHAYDTGAMVRIKIEYSTEKDGMAFSWLEPIQTAGKVYPYVVSEVFLHQSCVFRIY